MFTGLIEDVGKLHSREIRKGSGRLVLSTRLPLGQIAIGSSVAVNGACLTVVEKGRGRFTVDISPETLRRTNLGETGPGSLVNLERPLRLNDRLGGHFVTGHVDGVGVIEKIERRRQFTFIICRVPSLLRPLLVAKGSVAMDGISLTVNECEKRCFSVAVIPFTLKHTNLQQRRLGDKVNVEADIIGKYVRRLLAPRE